MALLFGFLIAVQFDIYSKVVLLNNRTRYFLLQLWLVKIFKQLWCVIISVVFLSNEGEVKSPYDNIQQPLVLNVWCGAEEYLLNWMMMMMMMTTWLWFMLKYNVCLSHVILYSKFVSPICVALHSHQFDTTVNFLNSYVYMFTRSHLAGLHNFQISTFSFYFFSDNLTGINDSMHF